MPIDDSKPCRYHTLRSEITVIFYTDDGAAVQRALIEIENLAARAKAVAAADGGRLDVTHEHEIRADRGHGPPIS